MFFIQLFTFWIDFFTEATEINPTRNSVPVSDALLFMVHWIILTYSMLREWKVWELRYELRMYLSEFFCFNRTKSNVESNQNLFCCSHFCHTVVICCSHFCYTVGICCSHYCYTVVICCSHYCHTVVICCSHFCYTVGICLSKKSWYLLVWTFSESVYFKYQDYIYYQEWKTPAKLAWRGY